MTYPEFTILRHGETEWNREGRLQGALDSPLTELGRTQAARQGEILRMLGHHQRDWIASPLGRARDTAEIARGRAVETDARLVEIGMGEWSGRSRDELLVAHPALFDTDGMGWYDHAPGGEGLAGLETRCRAFLADLTRPAVIVTHGITSRALRCIALGLPIEAFDTLEGGQGVVFHIRDGTSTRHGGPGPF